MDTDRYIVEGMHNLEGETWIHGAKNAALPILAASLLCGDCEIENCPDLSDIHAAENILRHLGCRTHWEQSQGSKVLCIHSEGPFVSEIPDQLMREMRSSIVFLGAMIARCGQAKLSYPGGCELGPRPIDLHLSSLKKLGVTIREDGGYLDCTAPKGLHAAQITLPFPSVGATENIMIAASMAQGETVIQNAAREPEILDLAGFLNACGAKVRILPDGTVAIEGVKQLHGCRYRVIPDRIVAVTYLCCCAVAKGELLLRGVRPDHLSAVLPLLEEMGCQLKTEKDTIRIVCRQPLRAPHRGRPSLSKTSFRTASSTPGSCAGWERTSKQKAGLRWCAGCHACTVRRFDVPTCAEERRWSSQRWAPAEKRWWRIFAICCADMSIWTGR